MIAQVCLAASHNFAGGLYDNTVGIIVTGETGDVMGVIAVGGVEAGCVQAAVGAVEAQDEEVAVYFAGDDDVVAAVNGNGRCLSSCCAPQSGKAKRNHTTGAKASIQCAIGIIAGNDNSHRCSSPIVTVTGHNNFAIAVHGHCLGNICIGAGI